MGKHYFFTTKEVDGKTRVFPLAGQTDDSGNAVETLNVSCSMEIRDSAPIGSYFVGDTLTKTSKGSSTNYYYTVKNFRLVDLSMTDICKELERFGVKIVKIEKTLLEDIMTDSTLKIPTSKDDGFYVAKDDWNVLVRNVKTHVNTLIIGSTGSGKTSVIKKLCEKLGKKLYIFDMGSIIDPISSLLGVHRLEDGKSVFDYAKFTQVIQEDCVVLLDELSRASIASNNILFPCLDDRRKLQIEVAGSKDIREIDVNPNCTFMATANVGAEYTGTNSLDKALVNRFFPLELNVIPSSEEETVLVTRCKVSLDSARMIVKVANNIRSLSVKQEISSSLSIRETIMVANLVHDGWDLGKAMEMIYLPLYEGTKVEGERSTVYKTISSY